VTGQPYTPPVPHPSVGERIGNALRAACHPRPVATASVGGMVPLALSWMVEVPALAGAAIPTGVPTVAAGEVDRLLVDLFEREGRSLVRLARLFVDDRNAAEDLVQEAFIRLARSAGRIRDEAKAAPYLRSIVLNLARDHNRRGLVSLRHRLPLDDERAETEDRLVLEDDQRRIIDALRQLPHRQRDCLVLRYYQELGIDGIAETLGIGRNSVKTHLQRGLAAMESLLAPTQDPVGQ
jgi:RNA polymerase sigma factor (sigma-70 family)